MNQVNKKKSSEKMKLIVVGSVVLIFILIGSFANIIFPGTTFALIIENSIGKFFNIIDFIKNHYVTILESITVVIFVWILNKTIQFLILITTRKENRSITLGKLFSSIVRYLSFVVALFLILSAWGVQTPTLLAGAGILGLAISFGAQSLIEDIFAGLFIIFEKQFVVGDIIQVGSHRGVVKEIGIRITKIEDLNGDVLIINNSDVRGAINTSCNPSVSICTISIEYGSDLPKVEKIVRDNLESMKKNIPEIIEGPFYDGLESLADSSIILRVSAKTDEVYKNRVRRALNREMILMFEKNQINIPFPQLTVHKENNENNS
ncbi:MAG: mechanosensitive ion channel family protein [Acholeplasmataceae bacterium]|nr:mechanosensitive ion channel family protein [Acholeplasmataceae bacterium]